MRGDCMANRTSDKQLNIRLTLKEYERLQQLADLHGLNVPQYAKRKLKNVKMKTPLLDRSVGHEIRTELRRTGVNMNQVAKSLNSQENPSQWHLEALRDIREDIKKLWQLFS